MISRIFFFVQLSFCENVSNASSSYHSGHNDWTSYSYTPNFTIVDGVPVDLIPFIPSPVSPDHGKYASCELPRGSGMMSGVCVPSLPSSDLPFCGEYVDYPVCVPGRNPMWSSWNWTMKDSVVRDQVNRVVNERKIAEDLSLANNGSSTEYLAIRFYGNDPCVAMYKQMVCYYNFPRCDGSSSSGEVSEILPICTERCVDFFTTCKYGSKFAADVCETVGSFWPMNVDDLANGTVGLNTSAFSTVLRSESGGSCTGLSN